MPDPFSSITERRLALLAVLTKQEPLTIQQLAAETGSSRHAIERALNCAWFQRLTTGRKSLFGLSAEGREKVGQSGAA